MSVHYNVSIDTGGTFTDCIATDSEGKIYRKKILSNGTLRGQALALVSENSLKIKESWFLSKDILAGYQLYSLDQSFESKVVSYDYKEKILTLELPIPTDLIGKNFALTAFEEAPVLGARLITETALHEAFPSIELRVGSTKGTNALLELKGAKTAFLVSQGFKDLLVIGNQARPDIFAMKIERPEPLYALVEEVSEVIDANGEVLQAIDITQIDKLIQKLKSAEIESIAICLKNSYRNSIHEIALKEALSPYFEFVHISTELSSQIKFQQRAETTVVNAYLAPVIHRYLSNIASKVGEGNMKVMTSAGSLVRYDAFHPKDSLFSGPAGGVVGASKVAQKAGIHQFIAFDMGGTSTDVARYDRELEYQFVQKIGNTQIFSPALAIETVAAGGGSICTYDGYKLSVGPESAGSWPGPACYGAGGPLAITDVNLLLGRLDSTQFGIPVFVDGAKKRLEEILSGIEKNTGTRPQAEEILEGFRAIANEKMAETVRKISIAKGYATTDYALVAFGGAGGLHVCGIAELLGISKILLPLDAGLLSAYGISQAQVERFAEASVLEVYDENLDKELDKKYQDLATKAMIELKKDGIETHQSYIKHRYIYLRLKGQDASLEIEWEGFEKSIQTFEEKYRQIYGHWTENRAIEVENIRLIAAQKQDTFEETNQVILEKKQAIPSHTIKAWVEGQWQEVPVFLREQLEEGSVITGFALLLDRFSTTVIEKGWELQLSNNGSAILTKVDTNVQEKIASSEQDITQLELFTNRFMSIADNMGVLLQRTSLSVNVKERLDFSCALLDHNAELIANAPHIPVHLGSLGVCVRKLLAQVTLEKGDIVITNHPKFGGSHLPDVTLIAPVYTKQGDQLIGYVVNRCHHSEIGGIRPASMPPDAKNLAEEGVVITPVFLSKNGKIDWTEITDLLQNAPYPSRAVAENLADLNAALASIKNGELALQQLVQEHSLERVHYYMNLLKLYSADKMQERLSEFPNGDYHAVELLDDDTRLEVNMTLKNGRCAIDFTGTSGVHKGNLNANEAIVNSVVIYVLRVLLQSNIPLNDGLLRVAELVIPNNTLLSPIFSENPEECPAVVGGNVELSQRLTDTLFKAFGIMACSQGTMNNTLFGNDSFGYYETICGGSGAGNGFDGTSGVHTHMTNTRITDPEILEKRYPVRLESFGIREGSGGQGKYRGGNGITRTFLFLEPVKLSILTQHRKYAPYGLNGGESGECGEQYILKPSGKEIRLAGVDGAELEIGDRLIMKTPGGGGYGSSIG